MIQMEDLLKSRHTVLLIEKRKKTKIVIACPHHAPAGAKRINCIEHPESDENSGIIARKVAEQLHASSIIACNYHVDSNKSLCTDYSIQIIKWKPKYLIEIHGHGGNKIGNLINRRNIDEAKKGIEISAGSEKNNSLSMKFASVLQTKLKSIEQLSTFNAFGDFTKIRFTASKTATITTNNWKALHIELPPMLRMQDKKLPNIATEFVKILVATITEVCN